MRKLFRIGLIFGVMLLALSSCSVSHHIPEGRYLLDNVRIISEDNPQITSELNGHIQQLPNRRVFGLFRWPLSIYCLSSTKDNYINRTLRNIGEPPHIYNDTLTEKSCTYIRSFLINKGYLHTDVEAKTEYSKHRANVTYYIRTKEQYYINSIRYRCADSLLLESVYADTTETLLHVGQPFNSERLSNERSRIASNLHDKGYYTFRKDYVTFIADTARNSRKVDLTIRIRNGLSPSRDKNNQPHIRPIQKYTIDSITFVVNNDDMEEPDTLNYEEIPIYFSGRLPLRPSILKDYSLLQRGNYYNATEVKDTYSSYARLGALKYTNISFKESSDSTLDCRIAFYPAKKIATAFELDVTNTMGDFGTSASLSFSNRNLFGGSELLSLKIRGAYENITQLQDYEENTFWEYGTDLGLTFPKLIAPFVSPDYQRNSRAVTQLGIQYNTQLRPEFHRMVLSASWSYLWNSNQWLQHRFDLLGINLVSVPKKDQYFIDNYLNQYNSRNSIMKFNYEDLMILRTGYSFYFSSMNTGVRKNHFHTSHSVRASIEAAGNLLSAAAHSLKMERDTLGQFHIANIAFAQYVKMDAEWTLNFNIDRNNAILLHTEAGVAYPYGNSRMLPFEKRYYAGGANGVRGWSVRGLGPGTYVGRNGTIDYINQSGDVKLDLSLEYRMRLFWKFNGAVFVDAGNIWTLYSYDDQPGGLFLLDKFYKQIAVAYGIGLRMDLNFLILRFDVAMKAINPTYTEGHLRYPIRHPNFKRDFAWHFAVGYPF